MSGLPINMRTTPLATPAVQAALLKEIGQQLSGAIAGEPLKVGQVVNARIVAGDGGTPVLVLGGVRVPAQLPGGVEVGQVLKLQVKESSPERVTLQIMTEAGKVADAAGDAAPALQTQAPAAQQAAANVQPWAVIPMPGGAQARMWLDPDGHGDGPEEAGSAARTRTMVVRYDSPILGRTDVVLRLDPAQLDATVLAPGGTPLDLVRSTVPELRLALAAAVERPVAVQTGGRSGGEDVDVRA